jgi:hypothetical protein
MIISLALRFWRESLIVVLLAAAVLAWRARDAALLERGVAQERSRVADSVLAAVRPRLAASDTAVVHDTVRVRGALRLVTKLDTAWRHDTVRVAGDSTPRIAVPVSVVEANDSLKSACSDLMSSCAVFRAHANTTIAALESKLASQPVAQPRSCTTSNVVWSVLSASSGFLAGRKTR